DLVTGVQTCALPICLARHALADERGPARDLPEVAVRLRDAHAGRERDLEQTVLVLERERLLVDDAAAGAPDQELALPLRRAQVQIGRASCRDRAAAP